MSLSRTYQRPPRGRPAIGFQVDVPGAVELRDGPVLRCREQREDGKTVGEIEVSVFAAPMVIDRDGILADKAREGIARMATLPRGAATVPVHLPGASGFRAHAVHGTELPYLYVFALAHDQCVDGGLLVTVRCSPGWAAADHILRSLRVLTRQGRVATSAETDEGPLLPVVAPRRE